MPSLVYFKTTKLKTAYSLQYPHLPQEATKQIPDEAWKSKH